MQSIIQTTLYLLTVLIPLTFTTSNSELFEFPKFILLLSGTLIIGASWVIDTIYKNERPLTRAQLTHPLSLSVIAILITQTIATLWSINPYTSFWGYYSRYHQGLLTTICYSIIYFAALKYLNKYSVQKIIKISVGTAFVISLYAVLQRLGIDKSLWIQDVVNRPFSTLGQPNWLAAYLLLSLFLPIHLARIHYHKSTRSQYFIAFAIIATAILFTKSRSGFLALVLSYPTYWYLLSRQFSLSKIKTDLIHYTLILALLGLSFGTPYTPSLKTLLSSPNPTQLTSPSTGTQLENGGTESGDIRKIVWTGALNLIKKHPFLGTGPETFAYTYYWERPASHNNTSEWDFLYNKAHNEYLNIAATTGLTGLLAYLTFHFVVFGLSLTKLPKSKKVDQDQENSLRELYPVLGAAITSFAITNFFGFSVIPVYFLMIVLTALPLASNHPTNSSAPFELPYLLLYFVLLLYPLNLFRADLVYAKGKAYLDANQAGTALPLLQQATTLRPGMDLYHSTLGEAYAQLGQAELAIKEVELTKKLNPYHLNFHKSRAKIYLTLAGLDSKYYEPAATELVSARKLSPTDPKLAYNLGLIYTRLGKNSEAASEFITALSLKPNYESPYYALTLLYEQTNQKNLVPDLLEQAKINLATYSATLKDKINQYTTNK